jgi:hypothetical protein
MANASKQIVDASGIFSHNLLTMINNETGTGNIVFNNAPTLTAVTVSTYLTATGVNVTSRLGAPAGASVTNSYDGDIVMDTTDDQLRYRGDTTDRVLSYKRDKGTLIETLSASDTYLTVMVTLDPITLLSVNCIVDPEENSASDQVNIKLQECDSTADNCTALTNGLNCTNSGASTTSFVSGGTLDANDYMILTVNALTGIATKTYIGWGYTLDSE